MRKKLLKGSGKVDMAACVWDDTTEIDMNAVVKGYHACPFIAERGHLFRLEQKQGERGKVFRIYNERGQLGHLQQDLVSLF